MSDCVLWEGAVNSGGCPVTWYKGKIKYAHRVIMDAKENEIVMHLCDTPRCVNPQHRKLATHAENSADMVKKKRQAVGESCGNSKLKDTQVITIRSYKGTFSSRKVAAMFNISKTNVLDIWNNKIWSHL